MRRRMKIETLLSRALNGLAQPELVVLNRPRSAFKLCGSLGLVCAAMLALALVELSGAATVDGARRTLVGANVPRAGEWRRNHHGRGAARLLSSEIAVVSCDCRALALAPTHLALFDATVLGWGVPELGARRLLMSAAVTDDRIAGGSATDRARGAGFTRYYVGVRLFPVQAIESLWVLCVVVAGSLMIVSGRPAARPWPGKRSRTARADSASSSCAATRSARTAGDSPRRSGPHSV